ncbi:glutathione S-transferase [Ectothiorhodospira shaposhnikovii]|uniref:glutathione S-transferase family protein n=1 Tax=Ectothiorhodospira shaposhnikovii TaxID=1054 RepID=UPI001904D0BA|nr:glutathione S-transferase family protein [Ectothiorhodospira shaposhnikovii]MBK1674457.1 glutathione S-transferase [Ectothiorhodospira shaposhnikovii]
MHLRLISFELCPFVQRSVITLRYKQAPYEIDFIDLEHPPEWFLALSPTGKVPVLQVDRQTVLFESAVINEFIDDITPPSLKPTDPLTLALNRAWIEFGSQAIIDQYRIMMSETEHDLEHHLAAAIAGLRRLEASQGEGPWFNGEAFSLVDAAYAPLFMRYALLNQAMPLFDGADFPRIQAWADRLNALEAVKGSVVPDFAARLKAYLRAREGYGPRQFAGIPG